MFVQRELRDVCYHITSLNMSKYLCNFTILLLHTPLPSNLIIPTLSSVYFEQSQEQTPSPHHLLYPRIWSRIYNALAKSYSQINHNSNDQDVMTLASITTYSPVAKEKAVLNARTWAPKSWVWVSAYSQCHTRTLTVRLGLVIHHAICKADQLSCRDCMFMHACRYALSNTF